MLNHPTKLNHWIPCDRPSHWGLTLAISILASSAAIAQPLPPPKSPKPTSPSASQTQIIYLGPSSRTPYMVIIPIRHLPTQIEELRQQLQQIRSIAPSAFFTQHRLGNCIYVQSFETSSAAHDLSAQLDRQGWDARVLYLRN